MNAIFSLWSALANLARSLNRLAAVADSVAEEAERRVEVVTYHGAMPAIETPDPAETAAGTELGHRNGRHRKAVASGNASPVA